MSASAGDEIEAALDLGDVELCAIKSVARDPRPGLGRSHGSRGAPKSLRNARALREQRQKSAIALQDAASAGAEGQQLYDHPPNSASSGGIGGDDKVKREVAIMKRLNHPNVVRLKEVIDDAKSKKVFMGAFVVPCGDPPLTTRSQCSSSWLAGRWSGKTTTSSLP